MSQSPKNSPPSTPSSPITLESLQALERQITQETKTTPSTSPPRPTEVPGRELRGPRGANIVKRQTKGALANFEEAVGGRDVLIDTLQVSTLDKKQEHFLRILCDPNRAGDSLANIAKDSDMLPSQIISMFRDASFAKAHAITQAQISEVLPNIVKDITDKSVDAEVVCPTCLGEGAESTCLHCNNRGYILRTSDLDRQKIALEIGGLLKKGGGVNVQVNQQVGMVSPNSFFSKYVRSSDNSAYDINVIEGEVDKDGSKG